MIVKLFFWKSRETHLGWHFKNVGDIARQSWHVNTCVAGGGGGLGMIGAHFCGLLSRWRWWWGYGRTASLWTMRSFAATRYQRIKTSWMPSKGGEWHVYQIQFYNLKAQNDNNIFSPDRVVDWYQWLNNYLDKCWDFWLLTALLLAWNKPICASHTVRQVKMEESASCDGQILQHILFSSWSKANDRAAFLLLLLSFIVLHQMFLLALGCTKKRYLVSMKNK